MMSGKDFLKSHVLRWWRKVYSNWKYVTSSGSAFQVSNWKSTATDSRGIYRLGQKAAPTSSVNIRDSVATMDRWRCSETRLISSDTGTVNTIVPTRHSTSHLHANQQHVTHLMWSYIHRVPEKKTSHLNFRHNFAICWDIFTIFEAPCSGLIAGWRNSLRAQLTTGVRPLPGVTEHTTSFKLLRALRTDSAHWYRISYHLTYGVW